VAICTESYRRNWRQISEVEAALTEVVPALFGETAPAGIHLQKITALPVKVSGLSIPNAKHSTTKNYLTLVDCCSFLVKVIMGQVTSWSHLEHKVTLKQAQEAAQMSTIKDAQRYTWTKLMGEEHMSKKDACIIGRGDKTGGWLTVLPNVMNGSILSYLKFRDGIRLLYAIMLQNLPTHCDGCQVKCNIDHALNCKKGGLVITCHNKVKDELGFLATLATSPNVVCD
jgi:hypothetical protein